MNKNSELDKNYKILENINEILKNKNKEDLIKIENLEKYKSEISKKFKNFIFENNNSKDLIIKLLRTKLNTIKQEINLTQNFYSNEIKNIQKEHIKMVENLSNKINLFSIGIEKNQSNIIRNTKESMEKEMKFRLNEKDEEMQFEINKIKGKLENNLVDKEKICEKKDKENKILVKK
jgi:hypothetical protein